MWIKRKKKNLQETYNHSAPKINRNLKGHIASNYFQLRSFCDDDYQCGYYLLLAWESVEEHPTFGEPSTKMKEIGSSFGNDTVK